VRKPHTKMRTKVRRKVDEDVKQIRTLRRNSKDGMFQLNPNDENCKKENKTISQRLGKLF